MSRATSIAITIDFPEAAVPSSRVKTWTADGALFVEDLDLASLRSTLVALVETLDQATSARLNAKFAALLASVLP